MSGMRIVSKKPLFSTTGSRLDHTHNAAANQAASAFPDQGQTVFNRRASSLRNLYRMRRHFYHILILGAL
jgi:hypothetical protein